MRYKNKWTFYLWGILISFVCSCSNQTDNTDYVKILRNQKIIFEGNSINNLEESKILILVPDSGDCTTCTMQIYDWYIYKLDIDKHLLNCDIVYILNESIKLNKSVTTLMESYKLNYMTNLSSFYSKNKVLKSTPFTTFLIDKENKIKLIGSPIENDKLWKLYKRALRK